MTGLMRTLLWLVVLGLLVTGSVWLADRPGDVVLDWGGWRIETSFGVAAAAVALLAAAVAAIYRLWLFFKRVPRRIVDSQREGRRRRGYLALTRGLVAVAAGDASEAHKQARKADGLLGDPPLTMLLSAQASQLAGDGRAAEKFFAAMLARPETEFLGLRGLIAQALKRGDRDKARELATRAFRLRPKSDWVAANLFDLQVAAGAWAEARDTMNRAARNGLMTADEKVKRTVVLNTRLGQEAQARGDAAEAMRYWRKAQGADPAFVPAAVLYARTLIARGKPGRAAALIERTWGLAPHPDLAALYASARRAETALDKVKAAQRLAKANPKDTESHAAIAAAALEAKLWGEARLHLGLAGGDDPPAGICRMWAELEESEHGDGATARAWLLRATQADPDPAWVCGECGHAAAEWSATCEGCGAFASASWRSPPHVVRFSKGPDAALPHAIAGPAPASPAPATAPAAPSPDAPAPSAPPAASPPVGVAPVADDPGPMPAER